MKLRITTSRVRSCRRVLLLMPLLTIVMLSPAVAQGGNLLHWSIPGDFDMDGLADTVVGAAELNGRVIPRKISWGDAQTTDLALPRWATRGFTAWPQGGASLVVALAGQSPRSGRDTVTIVSLTNWGKLKPTRLTLAESPLYERTLIRGVDLVDPAVRDLSGRIGYRFDPAMPVREPSRPTPSKAAVHLRAFPNPGSSIIHAELSNLPDAEYGVGMFALDGRRLLHETVVSAQGKARTDFDVAQLPIGRYFVRVIAGDDVIASASVTVIR